MRKLVVLLGLVFTLSLVAMAEEWTGYIADANCAKKQGAKAAADGHAGCAQGCIKKGAAAVLVTEEGKVYKLEDQSKVVDHAGQKVTVTGKLEGETIQVDSVKM